MILDVKPFTEQADLMNNEITVDMFNIKIKIQNLINIFLILNVLLIIVFIIILMVHISTNYTIVLKVLRSNHNNLNEKIGEHTTNPLYNDNYF